MRGRFFTTSVALLLGLVLVSQARLSHAQAFGVELHNMLMPASGGMAGTSIAQPQDVLSAIHGNPATIAQFEGTQFSFSGGWIEPTLNLAHTGNNVIPGVTPFSGKSEAEGVAPANIGVTQDFRALGFPVTAGIGLFSASGAGLSFRDVPESNGTTALFQVLQITSGVGLEVTDNLSAGASIMLGNATLDGPFNGLTGAATDYALRGNVGLSYRLGCHTRLGTYYQTEQRFNFDDAVRLQIGTAPITYDLVADIDLGLPDNIGFGIANDALCDGRLLLAVDVLFKQWDNTALFAPLYDNQWIFQFGGQYKLNERIRLRAGYAYADNITDPAPSVSAGGVMPPGGEDAIQYVQALFPAINEHRITFGAGIRDMLPGVDFDLLVGGMFEAEQAYGTFTSTSLESYWVSGGFTWRFGRGSCRRLPAPDDWGCACDSPCGCF
ncbi:MAG: hypothetical protein DWQ31_03340 [Planctomycetota bacterium]|nr:MAG: hypothetical protein DWQ31_03340 [Planctomycetota bacterium]REJ91580.1 MAG: hypothetical protein DWQ35_14150 [Planctomycetota bacterium]REK23078.1 MAG: hypothetical protein DWQ42_15810 [Planctomycetota bacterium]